MTKPRNHHPNPSDERDDIMTDRTRFPDGAKRCINCRAPVKNGEIKHLRGCPEYVKEKK
jgi:hypothetical protein